MVGAALDQHIARLHQGLADVHQRPDLALDHDGVVEALRLVEAGMARLGVVRLGGAILAEDLGLVAVVALPVGRKLDDAHDIAVGRRLQPEGLRCEVGAVGVRGQRVHDPEVGEADIGRMGGPEDAGRRAIFQEDRAALGVVARYDPADWFYHGWSPPAVVTRGSC